MSSLNPIPRSVRRQDFVAYAGQTAFQPNSFKVFDALDIRVRVKLAGTTRFVTRTTGFTVALTGPAPAYPVVTFALGLAVGDTARIEGARVPERSTDVTFGGAIRAAPLEAELDRAVVVAQEVRRDFDDVADRLEQLDISVAAAAGSAVLAEIARQEAEDLAAAAALSAGAANAALNQVVNAGAIFDTRALAAAAQIPAPVMALQVRGYYAAGDLGRALYKRVATPAPARLYHFQTADGAWWQLAETIIFLEMLGAKGDGSDATAAFNDAALLTKFIHAGEGTFGVTATWAHQSAGRLRGSGSQRTILKRTGTWVGPTFQPGGDTGGVGAYDFYVGYLTIQHETGNAFDASTNAALTNRLTNANCVHIRAVGGTDGVIEHVKFMRGVYAIELRNTTATAIRHCTFHGYWNNLVTGQQETIAYVRLTAQADGSGFCTKPFLYKNYMAGGGPSNSRTLSVGYLGGIENFAAVAQTYTQLEDIGARYAVLWEACEGGEIDGGYIGGQNDYGVYFKPYDAAKPVTNIRVHGIFFDGARLASIAFSQASGVTGAVTNLCHIYDNTFNGQMKTPHCIYAANPNSSPVARDCVIHHNQSNAHVAAPVLLYGATGFDIENNKFIGYHCNGGGAGTYNSTTTNWDGGNPEISAGICISGVSAGIFVDGCRLGGQVNNYQGGTVLLPATTTGAKWGVYDGGTGTIVSNVRARLMMTGGAVSTIAQTYPT